jgi:TRAP-type C4-dicarboxylate transport system substrate-binding protein
MKKRSLFTFVIVMIIGLALCGFTSPAEAKKKIVLKLVATWPPEQFAIKPFLARWVTKVNERAKGELEIKHIGGPEVMKAKDCLKNAGKGLVDLVVGAYHYYGRIVPQSTIVMMPYYPLDMDFVQFFHESGIFDRLSEVNERLTKTRLLGLHGFSDYVLCSTKPVTRLEDLKGMKIRVGGGYVGSLVKWLGGSPVKIPSPEIGAAAMTGVIDAAFRPGLAIKSWGEGDIWKHMLLPGQLAVVSTWISSKAWNKLPKHLQDLLMDESMEFAKWWNGQLQARTWVKELDSEFGIKVNWLSKEEQKRWRKIYLKIDGWYLKTGGPEAQEFIDLAHKQLKKMGYE